MRRKIFLSTIYAGSFIVVTVAFYAAYNFSGRIAEQTVKAEVESMAERALNRIEPVTEQVISILTDPVLLKTKNHCSLESIQKMREISLRHHLIQAIGYMQGTHLLCSTLGTHQNDGIDLGQPNFVTRKDWAVRIDRSLPFQNSGLYRFSSLLSTGYVVIVNSRTGFESVLPERDEGGGFVSYVDLKPIGHIGVWRQYWAQHFRLKKTAIFIDGDYVVAFINSTRFDYFSYAAISIEKVNSLKKKQMLILLPLGVVLSIFIISLLFYLTRNHNSLLSRLRYALKRDTEIFVLYQPIVDMESGRWVGAEALARWRLPNGEMVSPEAFVEVAENAGIINILTGKILNIIQNEASIVFEENPEFQLSINVAPSDIADQFLLDRLKELADSLGVQPKSLRIEATERTFIDANIANISLQRLRDQGHSIAIDDFGTGYSSLSYLAHLKVDVLKIDRAFVSTIGTMSVTSQVVQHIIEMAKSLQLHMVAEGVETAEQAEYLRARGVKFAQGWLYARPMPMRELAKALHAQSLGEVNRRSLTHGPSQNGVVA